MQNLLTQIKLIIDKYNEIEKLNATNFNIFSILNLERNEVDTHSYFIYELLNPKGKHNQGDVFLKLFLKTVLNINGEEIINSVKREDLTSKNRRIDFTISTNNYEIGIEMKIDASDQDKQLSDYMEELKSRVTKNNKQQEEKLYYLTLSGYEASNDSVQNLKLNEDYYTISFNVEILKWLEQCIEKSATIPTLREAIIQYRNLINKITNTNNNLMGKEMHTIIEDKNNIKIAGTIVNEYSYIWAKKELAFWNILWDKIENNISKEYILSDYLGIWLDENEKELSEEKSISIIKNIRDTNSKSVGFAIEYQINQNIRIDLYICEWDDNISFYIAFDKNNSDTFFMNTKLDNLIQKLGFTGKYKNERYKYANHKITFYKKNQINPTYELFDKNIFNQLIEQTAQEILDIVNIIDINREDVLNAIK
jgi:hypothetical protein